MVPIRRESAWHVLAVHDDLELRAICGYVRPWVRAQQSRAAAPPEPSCSRCLTRSARVRPAFRRPSTDERLRNIAAAIPPERGLFTVFTRRRDGSRHAEPGAAAHWGIQRTDGDHVAVVFESDDADAVATFLPSRVVDR